MLDSLELDFEAGVSHHQALASCDEQEGFLSEEHEYLHLLTHTFIVQSSVSPGNFILIEKTEVYSSNPV